MSACPRCGVELSNFGCELPDCNDEHADARCAERLVARVAELEDNQERGIRQLSEANLKIEALRNGAAATRAKLERARDAIASLEAQITPQRFALRGAFAFAEIKQGLRAALAALAAPEDPDA